MNGLSAPLVLFGLAVAAFGGIAVWSLARRYRRDLGLAGEQQERTQDLSFIINAFQDVTRQLKEKEKELDRLRSLAEQRAENVESYTENILHCVTSGVITFDGNGLATTMNRAAEEILGLEPGSGRGRTCGELFSDSVICGTVRETRERGSASRRMETRLSRSGDHVWLGFNTALLTDRQGTSLGVILSFSDLTEVKRLQEQVELRERLSALGEMSAGIAHELRNPMAVIAGYLQLLAKRQDEAGQEVIRDITTEIGGMNRIIGDLLTFARPTALNRIEVGLRELVDGCLETALQGRSANLRTSVDLPDVTVLVDEGLMRQAVGNIILNATEAMPGGGTLSVTGKSGGGSLLLRITDTGAGMPPEVVKKVFLPFFTTKEKGVGMGLALAHKIITSHGGRIEVESEEGRGTAFLIVLPQQ